MPPVHLQPREVFDLAKKLYRHEMIELVSNTLDRLQDVSDDSTARFTQEALEVLDEKDQELEDDTRESGKRRQRE